MQINALSPRQSLNKAYLKVRPSRSEIEKFKKNLIILLDGLIESESEEHNKNDLGDFLKNTFYQPKFYINTKDRTDLVIHNGADSKSLPGILIEAKKPSNRYEMISRENLNGKAMNELILYYLRERITGKNLEIKHLVATNIYEWFVFDAVVFDKVFAQNKKLVQQFSDFEEGRLASKSTDFFYKEIAEPFLRELDEEITFTWFDFREYQHALRNEDKKDDAKLIALYKLLSPEHLLKLPFANDSNSLDRSFYTELLHIIGLSETKEGNKKVIGRKKDAERNAGSLIESAIVQLDNLDKISRLEKSSRFGDTVHDKLFNVALELSITWINRILFLKLLEAQIVRYHKGDPSYAFLNCEKVRNFDDLNSLFFGVLARLPQDRREDVKKLFENVPYLNSSLFEPTPLEHSCFFIGQLKDEKLPVLSSTVLKDNTGKKFKGELFTLEYLFKFLDAYDFSSEGSEEIQEENKTLINASVLGLIFEKINGYKDGSFFTPGFITMYMCRETIRRAVIQKFKDIKGWECEDLQGLYNKIEDIREANQIINQLKICDPAVGSGHFLVSALNEIIAIKSELKILSDRNGKRLKEYHVEVVNDELIITDEDGDLFEYNPANPESQRVQETLFLEKQTIIENCLFGVDINPNSVKICRLRLWIELLKNSYYKPETHFTELETLPNIDINIKCGNSLISRYSLDADIKQALKKSKWSIDNYRLAVMSYRNATTKEQKREMERLIDQIKSDFETEVAANDKRVILLKKLNGDLFNLTQQTSLFERSKKELAEWNKKVSELTTKIKKLESELEEIKNNKIFENAFEWRFEFPEVLNDEGDFIGFDTVVGNPPYGINFNLSEKKYFKNLYKTIVGKYESYGYFIELGLNLIQLNGCQSYITPHTWLTVTEARTLRDFIFENSHINEIIKLPKKVFEDATVETIIFINAKKRIFQQKEDEQIHILVFGENQTIDKISDYNCVQFSHNQNTWKNNPAFNALLSPANHTLLKKCQEDSRPFSDFCDFSVGVQAYDSYSGQSLEIIKSRLYHSNHKKDVTFVKELNGKDIYRYIYKWPGDSWISYGEWLAHPRQKKFFDRERILIREITNNGTYQIAGCISDEYMINYKSVLNIILNEKAIKAGISLKFILGVINSSLISWIFNLTSNKIVTETFPRISILDIKRFPLKGFDLSNSTSRTIHDLIVNNVEQIIYLKKINPKAEIQFYNNKIDGLVFELYGLTKEEIRTIETENS